MTEVIKDQAGKLAYGIEDDRVQNALKGVIGKAAHHVHAFTERVAGKNKLMSAIGNTLYRHGKVAEQIVGTVLQHSGLFDTGNIPNTAYEISGPIQNRSDNGVDFVGLARTGKFAGQIVSFEFKAGLLKKAPGLEGDQKLGAALFVPDRVRQAIAAVGRWQSVSSEAQSRAQYVSNTMGSRVHSGFVVSIDHLGVKGKEDVRFAPWVRQ